MHPCTPCAKLGRGSECVYGRSPDTDGSVSSSDPNSSNAIQKGSCPSDSDISDESEPPVVRERFDPEMQLVSFRGGSPKPHQLATTSTFSFLPSLRFASIPHPLHTPLSLIPEHLQVSDTTPSELGPDTDGPVSSSDPNSSNDVQQGSCPPDSDTLDEFEPPVVQERSNPEMQIVPF